MEPDDFNGLARHSHRGSKFELFFYEQVGTRYYLRFTRLALVLVVCLTVIPILALFALFLTQRHADLKNVNVDITVPSQAPGNYGAPIVQPTVAMPTPLKAGRSQRGEGAARPMPTAPGLNTNAPLPQSPTPSPTPLRPPD